MTRCCVVVVRFAVRLIATPVVSASMTCCHCAIHRLRRQMALAVIVIVWTRMREILSNGVAFTIAVTVVAKVEACAKEAICLIFAVMCNCI